MTDVADDVNDDVDVDVVVDVDAENDFDTDHDLDIEVDIDVDVENGVVTLSGKVKSDAEEDLVVTTAENVSDVKEVVNKLQVM